MITLWEKEKLLFFLAISPFVTVFLKVVCSRGVRKRVYVGKGKNEFKLEIDMAGVIHILCCNFRRSKHLLTN